MNRSPHRRRFVIALLIALGVLLLAGAAAGITLYLRQPSTERAGLADEVSMFAGVLSMTAGFASLAVAVRQLRAPRTGTAATGSADPQPQPQPQPQPPETKTMFIIANAPQTVAKGVMDGNIHEHPHP